MLRNPDTNVSGNCSSVRFVTFPEVTSPHNNISTRAAISAGHGLLAFCVVERACDLNKKKEPAGSVGLDF